MRKAIIAAALLSITVMLPSRMQIAVGIVVLAVGMSQLTAKSYASNMAGTRFDDAVRTVKLLEPLDGFDKDCRREITSALDECVREYALAITSDPESSASAMHVSTHMDLRHQIHDLLSHASVVGGWKAVESAEQSLSSLFSSFDNVLYAGKHIDMVPSWSVMGYPSTCGHIPGKPGR